MNSVQALMPSKLLNKSLLRPKCPQGGRGYPDQAFESNRINTLQA
jgi:hypothetical protein